MGYRQLFVDLLSRRYKGTATAKILISQRKQTSSNNATEFGICYDYVPTDIA